MTVLFAFLVGGALCLPAQFLIDRTRLTPARILVLYVVSGVTLGALGIYDKLFAFAGCGASVPLLGFGGNIARGVRDAVAQDGALGILKGPFSAASVGTSAALVFGCLTALFSGGRPKRM